MDFPVIITTGVLTAAIKARVRKKAVAIAVEESSMNSQKEIGSILELLASVFHDFLSVIVA